MTESRGTWAEHLGQAKRDGLITGLIIGGLVGSVAVWLVMTLLLR